MDYFVTPQQFGAIADGIIDDTAAIRKAIDVAFETTGCVYFPRGIYRTDVIRLRPEVALKSEPSWSYARDGKTVIVPLSENQECLIDASNAIGVTLSGLCFSGKDMGENMHGLFMSRENKTEPVEHSLRIDECLFCHFTGNGMHLSGAWAVSMRHSQCRDNAGYGCYLDGCDAFICDNWFSTNGKAGFGGDTWNSAVNFTSNRIEWNRECGVRLCGSMRFNLTGNYFDRSFGPAIIIDSAPNYHKRLKMTHTVMPYAITITGNTIVRSGKTAEPDSDMDCHILLKNSAGITITGNTFNVWKDDGRNGRISPNYGIITEKCSHCVIANNAMLPGAVKQLILDKGGHGDEVVIKDNVGDVVPEKARNVQDPFTPVHFMSEGGAPWYSEKLAGENR